MVTICNKMKNIEITKSFNKKVKIFISDADRTLKTKQTKEMKQAQKNENVIILTSKQFRKILGKKYPNVNKNDENKDQDEEMSSPIKKSPVRRSARLSQRKPKTQKSQTQKGKLLSFNDQSRASDSAATNSTATQKTQSRKKRKQSQDFVQDVTPAKKQKPNPNG